MFPNTATVFFSLSLRRNRREGTGLGLSISYDIVTQQHGATIAVDSVPGEFTEFTIRLPRRGAG